MKDQEIIENIDSKEGNQKKSVPENDKNQNQNKNITPKTNQKKKKNKEKKIKDDEEKRKKKLRRLVAAESKRITKVIVPISICMLIVVVSINFFPIFSGGIEKQCFLFFE